MNCSYKTIKNCKSIVQLGMPIFVAQMAVLFCGISDSIVAGHLGASQLAAIGIGSSIWIAIFATFLGVVQGIAPMIAKQFGGQKFAEIENSIAAGLLIAVLLSFIGIWTLIHSSTLLTLINAPLDVRLLAKGYLDVFIYALPAAMLVRVFYAFTPAVGISHPVMFINIVAFFIKVPLSVTLAYGYFGFPQLGAIGCAIGSVVMFWTMLVASLVYVYYSSRYSIIGIRFPRRLPTFNILFSTLRVGIPMAISQFSEIGSFTILALFIAKYGANTSAAHQIIASITSVFYMIPMALGIATQALVSQNRGAGEYSNAKGIALAGLVLTLSLAMISAVILLTIGMVLLRIYSDDLKVVLLASIILPISAGYHLCDAVQCVTSSILRAYEKNVAPTIYYVLSLWGIGVGCGWLLSNYGVELLRLNLFLDPMGFKGYWISSTAGLLLASIIMLIMLANKIKYDVKSCHLSTTTSL
ncbi:MATE family efflux transporter [Sodalis sp. RH14]|uniref:MATE family efflux transporter n=1 Tax=Sodalis sp. RH14 TaxID=3394329 RepID=UPI0039B4EF58